MLFYAPLFLFLFFPLMITTVLTVRHQYRNRVLLVWSVIFYLWGEPSFLGIVTLSAIIDYLIGARIFLLLNDSRSRHYLTIGVILNLLLLAYYKYIDFGITSINLLLHPLGLPNFSLLRIALPIGISFIVFEKITYLVDIYRGRGEPARSLGMYLLYIFFFPKLLAGPIVKYHDLEPQLSQRQQNPDDLLIGFRRFLIGLTKKVLLADTLSEVVDQIFSLQLHSLSFTTAWIGLISFTLQIYFDFSGYSDMAIGLAQMLGFSIAENFNMPYISTSFTEFWRRWHISLSTWIKEYLYISLGGNRLGTLRTYLNLWICFILSGLWHGASWTFVLWGIYHGLFLVLDKLFWLRLSQKLPNLVKVTFTFFFIMLGWLLFRVTSLEQFMAFIMAMFNPSKDGVVVYITANVWTAIGVGSVISIIPAFDFFRPTFERWRSIKISRAVENWLLSSIALISIGKAITVTFNPFLYFRF
jgi:alginate O-acetyltransferase complex protein AlgI